MAYSITGENNLGKWRLIRPTKAIADKVAKAKRRISGNKNVRVHKIK